MDDTPQNPTETAGAGYDVGQWAGITQYRCKFCPWDTVTSEAAMLDHIRQAHPAPAPPPVSHIIPVYDRFNNLVNPEAGG